MLVLAMAVWIGAAGCATTDETPEQAKLEKRFEELGKEKAALDRERGTVDGAAAKLFDKASSTEKKKGLASSKSFCLAPEGLPIPQKGGSIGPLEFDRKQAWFKIKEKPVSGEAGAPSGRESGMTAYEVRLVPEGGDK